MTNLNKKFIDVCKKKSCFSMVPFAHNEFEDFKYKKPSEFFNFFWKKYLKFKTNYKLKNKKEINNSYNGSALEIILCYLFTRENIQIENMDEEIDIKFVKPDFLLKSNNKNFFISVKVSLRERWKQADWEAIKYKEKYPNSVCILLMNNKNEYKSMKSKLNDLTLDALILADENIDEMINSIKG